jgi:hypothetical protein
MLVSSAIRAAAADARVREPRLCNSRTLDAACCFEWRGPRGDTRLARPESLPWDGVWGVRRAGRVVLRVAIRLARDTSTQSAVELETSVPKP